MADDKPIIVIKKKGGHGGHHGGAWKVAYADFVTAMMCFFMVMWLINSADTATKKNIASYFRKPGIFQSGSGTPLLMGEAGILEDAFVPPQPEKKKQAKGLSQDPRSVPQKEEIAVPTPGSGYTHQGEEGKGGGLRESKGKGGAGLEKTKDEGFLEMGPAKKLEKGKEGTKGAGELPAGSATGTQQNPLEQVAQQIRQQIAASPELQKLLGIVDVKVDADGVNLDIMDTDKTSMFKSGSAVILTEAQQAFRKLASMLRTLPNKIDIVGHTDAKPFSSRIGYSNWELSGDRANAARRLLEIEGIPPERIASVVGRADKELKLRDDPFASANRRITLKMRFNLSSPTNLVPFQDMLSSPEAIPQMTEEAPLAGPSANQDQPGAQNTTSSQAASPADQSDTVHSVTPKEIITGYYKPRVNVKAKESERIRLPEPNNEGASATEKKDKIFGDSPVFGPGAPFTGF